MIEARNGATSAMPWALQGVPEGEAQLLLVSDVRQHAPAVRGVERLDDDGPAEALGERDGVVLVVRDRAPRHGHAVVPEQGLGQALVAGDLDAELAGRRGNRRLDALLVNARAEHDEGTVVQAQVRNPARRRDGHDRARRGAERPALARAPEGDRDADLLLDLEGDVLGHVAEPGPFGDALQEPPRRSFGAVMLLQTGQQTLELFAEPRDPARRALREGPEIDPHPDARAIGPVVRSVQDERLEKADAVGHGSPLRGRDYKKSPSA